MLEWLGEILLWIWGISFLLTFLKGWRPSQVIGHWRQPFENSTVDYHNFYVNLIEVFQRSSIPNIKVDQVVIAEGIKFISPNRVYLRVSSNGRVMDICYATYGDRFFVSWWLFEKEGFWKIILGSFPWIGPKLIEYLDPITYYRYDSAVMFQSMIHEYIVEMIDKVADGQGSKMSESERKPHLKDIFKR